jgi:signal transduction histidine kinase
MKYLGLLMFSMVVPLLFAGGCLYYLIFSIMAEQIGIPEYIARGMFPVIHKVNIVLLIGVPPLFILLIFWGIIVSHRFAGPVERLEKELKRVVDHGNYSHHIKVRRNDDMKPIADSVNDLLRKLEERKK